MAYGFINIETWMAFFATRVVYFYSLPLVVITLGLAFFLNMKKYSKKAKVGFVPFLLRLGEYSKQKKRKILLASVTVMVVLQVIMMATVW